jgi:hypothetical protein
MHRLEGEYPSPLLAGLSPWQLASLHQDLTPLLGVREGFSHFVTGIAAPVASGWSGRRWGLHPLESAAFARRTPKADIADAPRGSCSLSGQRALAIGNSKGPNLGASVSDRPSPFSLHLAVQ